MTIPLGRTVHTSTIFNSENVTFSGSRNDLTEPLLGQDAPDDNNAGNDASKLEMLLAIDESTEWNEEGNLSICTSLSSLDNDSITGFSSTQFSFQVGVFISFQKMKKQKIFS